MPKVTSSEFVICPYCSERYGDAFEWAAAKTEGDHMICNTCGQTFVYWAEHEVTYHTRDIEGGELLRAALAENPTPKR